jgi:hypothetical protein
MKCIIQKSFIIYKDFTVRSHTTVYQSINRCLSFRGQSIERYNSLTAITENVIGNHAALRKMGRSVAAAVAVEH